MAPERSGDAGVTDALVVDVGVDAGRGVAVGKGDIESSDAGKETTIEKDDTGGTDAEKEAIVGTVDIEEGSDAYKPGGLHPVYIGDVYVDKYEVVSKLGWGRYSTVWLVKDLSKEPNDEHRFRALKVLSDECYGHEHSVFEREILRQFRDGNRKLLGYKYICHLVDDFELTGPNGTHLCLVLELVGETLASFGVWFLEDRVPTLLMRKFSFQLVCALDFAHENGVIHTDIKPDNIFVKVLDTSQIESGYLAQEPIPKQNRTEERYTPIKSLPLRRFYFGGDMSRLGKVNLALGDWGVSSWFTKHLTENIQPVALRAPEVLIKAKWDKQVDVWNLGAVLLEVYRAVQMFSGRVPPDGHYERREHLAEMVALFGPFPKRLLELGDAEIVESVFDDDGRVKEAIPVCYPPLASEEFLPGLNLETREMFASFLGVMMRLHPAERLTPEQLVKHPWLRPGQHRLPGEMYPQSMSERLHVPSQVVAVMA